MMVILQKKFHRLVLTAARRPVEWVDKAANPSKCLAALFLILERFFSKN